MPDEITPGTTAAPAAQPQGSAPENNNQQGNVGGEVDPAKKQLEDGSIGKAFSGIKLDLFKSREKVRDFAAENESLKAENAALKASRSEPKREVVPEAKPSWWDNPEDSAAQLRAQAKQDAVTAANEVIAQREAEARFITSANETENWLLSREHLKQDPNAGKEVLAIIQSKYSHVLGVDPKSAGRSAYLDWCESKGIEPDLGKRSQDASHAYNGTGVRPSAAGSSGGSGEVTAQQLKAMSVDEREKAIKSGRYKGTVIRL